MAMYSLYYDTPPHDEHYTTHYIKFIHPSIHLPRPPETVSVHSTQATTYMCNSIFTLSPGNSPAGNLVTGGAVVNIGGTSCTSSTMTTTSNPAIFLVSCPGSAYASYTLKRGQLSEMGLWKHFWFSLVEKFIQGHCRPYGSVHSVYGGLVQDHGEMYFCNI